MYKTFHRARINIYAYESLSIFETYVIISQHARTISLSHRPHFFQPETTCRPSFPAHAKVRMICTDVYLQERERAQLLIPARDRERNISASQVQDSVGHYATKLGRCINLYRALEPSQRGSARFLERRGKDENVFCFSPPRSNPSLDTIRKTLVVGSSHRVGTGLYSFGVGRPRN